MGNSNGVFAGMRVLELATVLAGPSVGQFFAELGAEVIKVENPETGGDVTRTWKIAGEQTDDRSAYFCSCNWGKKSITLNLYQKTDYLRLMSLVPSADVVIASYKPGDAEKLGVDYKTFSEINPKLIYGQITGYGLDDDRVGYDALIQAEAGFIDLNGESSGPGVKMPVALIDILAGHHLKEGLLLALLNRERTGRGDYVQVSLIEAAITSLANQATNWLITGELPHRKGSAHPNIAPYGDSFITRDGKRILLAVGNDKQFANLCLILKLESPLLADRFTQNIRRVEGRDILNELLAERFRQFDARELLSEMNASKIPAGLIQNVKEVFEMPASNRVTLSSQGLWGLRNFISSSARHQPLELTSPPHLGEHQSEFFD
jgi:crotonobetainyl-CoA:carnitine CoA-transferase CaiB-like acyl-CoA transferase